MILFLFIFISSALGATILLESYKNPNSHILIRCGNELMKFPKFVKVVKYITPVSEKLGISPLKFITIFTYLFVFLICLSISAF